MQITEALRQRRTIRKFEQKQIPHAILEELVDYARISACGANLQPLKYMILDTPELLEKVYPLTKWAGYLPDGAPGENERPMAYIAILTDKQIKESSEVDAGSAITSMMLGAMEHGLGSCWLGAIQRPALLELFKLSPEQYQLSYLLALGYPAQQSKTVSFSGDVRYYPDEDGSLCVPKRSMEEILLPPPGKEF